MAAGGMIFVEVALQQATSRTVTQVTVDIFNYGNSQTAFKRNVTLPATLGRVLVPVMLPPNTTPGNWQLRVYAPTITTGTMDSFITGDWIVNTGAGRIGRHKALTRYPLLPRNQTMAGGLAGTLPTGWSAAVGGNMTGVTLTVTRVGADMYGNYVEVALSGTTTHAGSYYVFAESAGAMEVAPGQIWQYYVPIRLVAGSLANASTITGTDGTTGSMQLSMPNYGGSGTWLAEPATAITPTSAYTTYGKGDWGSFAASTSYVMPAVSISFANAVAVAVTLRIYVPTVRRII
jgi:hypothetical protein